MLIAFGLIAAGHIPKAAFNAFALLHELGAQRLMSDSASALITRRADGKVLWRSGDLVATGEYLPGPDLMATEANRERALRQLAADLARKAAELLGDSF